MSLPTALRALLTRTVTIASASSRDAGGAATYGTAVTYPARVEHRQRQVKDGNGRDVLATTVVYVGTNTTGAGLPSATPQSRITLPDGTTPPILTVERQDDLDGAHHEVVFCG